MFQKLPMNGKMKYECVQVCTGQKQPGGILLFSLSNGRNHLTVTLFHSELK
uniref:Uncharacterized protein n=1 Tax=Anguilla anguilla TaxID=7936 RepID=A0A0E9WIG0_ANGAN